MHQSIEPSELPTRCFHGMPSRIDIRDVAFDGMGIGSELRRKRLYGAGILIGAYDLTAFTPAAVRDGGANAACRASDQYHLAGKAVSNRVCHRHG